MADSWYVGNANTDGQHTRGWLLGHFIGEGVRASDAVEVKWGAHRAGEQRDTWTAGEQRTTLLLLVHGRFRLELAHTSLVLEREGDYAVWGPGIDHRWTAEEDSTVITVRWPSLP